MRRIVSVLNPVEHALRESLNDERRGSQRHRKICRCPPYTNRAGEGKHKVLVKLDEQSFRSLRHEGQLVVAIHCAPPKPSVGKAQPYEPHVAEERAHGLFKLTVQGDGRPGVWPPLPPTILPTARSRNPFRSSTSFPASSHSAGTATPGENVQSALPLDVLES